MPRTDCKQADIWAAALDAGELDEPSRLRLMEHLDDCQACRERAQGLSALAGLLRDEPAIFPRHRATAIWRNVEAAAMAAPPKPVRATPRRRRAIALACAAAALLALGASLLLTAPDDSAPAPAPAVAKNTPKAPAPAAAQEAVARTAPAAVMPAPAPVEPENDGKSPRRWKISWVNGQAKTGDRALDSGATLTAGDSLQVASQGRALLVGPSEVLVVGEGTSLELEGSGAGDDRVRLERGQVTVLTRHEAKLDDGPRRPVEVAVANLVVRPMGTVFSVSWSGSGAPQISLAEGRLVVASATRSVTLEAPTRFTWGEQPRRLSGDRARRMVRRLTSAGQRDRQGASTAARSASGVSKKATGRSSLDAQVSALEQLLREGKTAQLRARVEELLGDEGLASNPAAPALFSLVAESYLRQGNYARARDAYLRTWKLGKRTRHGMDALYNAGTIALDQLRQPSTARGNLERYLASYPRGSQRQGAYYMLHRCLKQLGAAGEAASLADKYRAEFPSGQYLELLK